MKPRGLFVVGFRVAAFFRFAPVFAFRIPFGTAPHPSGFDFLFEPDSSSSAFRFWPGKGLTTRVAPASDGGLEVEAAAEFGW